MDLSFPASQTALLVIDPLNDFLSEGGAAYELTRVTLRLHDVVANLRKAIDAAHACGIKVLFGPMAFTDYDYAAAALQRRSGINRFMYERKMFLAGSWGAGFHPDLVPGQGDIVLAPHKSIDVFETDLPSHLERLGITRLVIAGMAANLCCESTGRHAMEKGYDVTFLADAIGASDVAAYETAVHLNYPLIGNGVLKVEEFVRAMDASAMARGDTVVGSDHLEIGKVRGTEDGHFVVARGLLRSRLFVPLDAVVRRAGTRVFINFPRILLATMPWKKRPRRTGRAHPRTSSGRLVTELP